MKNEPIPFTTTSEIKRKANELARVDGRNFIAEYGNEVKVVIYEREEE